MSSYDTIRVETTGRVAVVTIDRPEARNAIGPEVQTELEDFLRVAALNDGIGAIVITGAGDKAFVAGADLGALRNYTAATALESRLQRLYDEIENFPKPTIAAVNGYALGGGCELAMACDIRIASTTASFGLPETGLGILPGAGGTQRLSRLVGAGLAVDMILTGRRINAQHAERFGLVSRLSEPSDLLADARAVAEEILSKGPLAIRLATLAVRSGGNVDQSTGLLIERLAQALLYSSEDKEEGVQSFLDKRTPQFSGR